MGYIPAGKTNEPPFEFKVPIAVMVCIDRKGKQLLLKVAGGMLTKVSQTDELLISMVKSGGAVTVIAKDSSADPVGEQAGRSACKDPRIKWKASAISVGRTTPGRKQSKEFIICIIQGL